MHVLKFKSKYSITLYNIVFLLLTLNKYLPVGCEKRVVMFWKLYFKAYFIQQFIIAPNWDKLRPY